MGRYDGKSYVTVGVDDIPVLLSEPKLRKSKARLHGVYNEYEIRVNLVPYTTSGNILLFKAIRRENGRTNCTLEIPQTLLSVSHDFDVFSLDPSLFEKLIFTNLYAILVDGDILQLDDPCRLGIDDLRSLLGRMGLFGCHDYKFLVHLDEVVMVKDHCIDVYLMVEAERGSVDADFIGIPAGIFKAYAVSKYPTSYSMDLGFHPEDYNEKSTDFRMNPDGKAQICTVVDELQRMGVI